MRYLIILLSVLLTACASPVAPEPTEPSSPLDDRACYLGEPVRIIESYERLAVVYYDARPDTLMVDKKILDDPIYCYR